MAQWLAAILLIGTFIVELVRLILKLISAFDEWKKKKATWAPASAGAL